MKTSYFKYIYIASVMGLLFVTAYSGILNAGVSRNSSSTSSSTSSSGSGDSSVIALPGGAVMETMTIDGEECNVCHPPITEICGNGVIGPGEQCDGEAGTDDTHNCDPKTCQKVLILETCGDGKRKDPEACDDGNKINDDSCTNACQLPKCGDGIKQTFIGEQCDDGNDVDGDGCSSSCQNEPYCGDGIMPEKVNGVDKDCDAGVDNGKDTSGCSSTCKKTAYCGNGVTENPPEECDDGELVNGTDASHCNSDCTAKSLCGNKNIDSGETCDDGNHTDGDGCDSSCQLEPIGLTCADGKQSDDGSQYTSGTYEIDSGGTITSLTAISTTQSVCGNPASISGKSGTVTGDYVAGKNMDDCKVEVTAKDSNNQEEKCTITIKGILDHCATYLNVNGDTIPSIYECSDGKKCTTTNLVNNGGTCSCPVADLVPC